MIQVNNITNETGNTTIDLKNVKKIMRNNHIQQYIHKLNNLEERTILQKPQTTNINEDETESVTSPITFKDIEYIILSLPEEEISRRRCFYWRILTNI